VSITATGSNPVVITVGTTATTDARTDNVATPFMADTRAWRYNDGISVTINGSSPGPAASVTGFGLEFETQGGGTLTVDHQAGASISQTSLPVHTTRTDALSLIGSGGVVTYTGNGTVSSTVSSGVVLIQTQAGAGNLVANINNNISTSANGSVGALILDQFSPGGTGNVSVTVAGGVSITQSGEADTYGGIFAKARGTGGGDATVTLAPLSGTTSISANGTGIAGVQADSLAGVATVTTGPGGAASFNVASSSTGGNSGIFAASGKNAAGTDTVSVTLGASSTIAVGGGDDNSGIFAVNFTDDPNTGADVVSTGNIHITAAAGSGISVGGAGTSNNEGIGAYTNDTTGTATSIAITAGGTITVTGDTSAGINARQQAVTGSGNVSVTTNSTINVTDTAAGGTSYGIRATNAGSGTVSVTSTSLINTGSGTGSADVTGIEAAGNAGVTVNMTGGQIGTNADRVGVGIHATSGGTAGDVDVTARTIFATKQAVLAEIGGTGSGNIGVTVVSGSQTQGGISAQNDGSGTATVTLQSNASITGNSPGLFEQTNGNDATVTLNNTDGVTGSSGIVARQNAIAGTGDVSVTLGDGNEVTGQGNDPTDPHNGNGIFAKNFGTPGAGGGTTTVTLGAHNTIIATGVATGGVSGILAESLGGNVSITTNNNNVVLVNKGSGTGNNSGIFAGADEGATPTSVTVNLGANTTVSVTGGSNNSAINVRDFADNHSPVTGPVSLTIGNSASISVIGDAGAGINMTGTGSANLSATIGTGTITVTDNNAFAGPSAGVAVHTSGGGNVTINSSAAVTVDGSGGGFGIAALATTGNIDVDLSNGVSTSNGIGVLLVGGTTNTIDTGAAATISGTTGVQVNGGSTTLTAGADINGSLFDLDIVSGTLVLQGTGISNLGNVHDTGVFDINRGDTFAISGVISGSGAVEQNGIGITNLNGANSYTGVTTVNAGTVGLNNDNSLGATSAGTTAANATILAYGNGVTIAEAITLNGTTSGVAFDETGGSATQSGVIAGTGPLNKTGAGTLVFTGTDTYTGPTNINAGTLRVDGTLVNSATTVHSGGTLAGTGTTAAVTVESGGTLAPGASPGILHTGDLSLQSSSTLSIEISGATPGAGGYDQVAVTGSVSLAGDLSTSLLAGFHPATGSTLTIIDNDGNADPVIGTFAGLNEGAQFTQAGSTYSISYQGGDGNDVVLTALNDAPALANVDATAGYTENAAPVTLDTAPLIAVSDPDSTTLAGATVHIAAGTFVGDGDVLAANTAGTSITAVYDDTTEMLTLSGLDSLANYQQVLQSVTFESTSDNPTNFGADPSRTIAWQLDDGGAVNNLSTVQTTTLDITAVNDRPFLLNVALTAAYGPGTPGSVLSPGLQTGDVDNLNLASATVQIIDGHLLGDELFVNLPTSGGFFQVDDGAGGLTTTNISVESNSLGRLVLSGADTPTHYQEVLDAVSYHSTAADPSNSGHNPTRTITWQVNDGTVASPLLQTPATYGVGSNPVSIATADLNGDGVLDLAVADSSSNQVSVLIGNGDGTFAPHQTFAAGTIPVQIAIGDLDGDGFLDFAVANATGSVSILRGDGAGSFSAPTTLTAGIFPDALAIGDVNADGKPDLAVANGGSGNVSLFLGTGGGGFAPAGDFNTGVDPSGVVIGDFNNDGKADLAVSNLGPDTVAILLGNGAGSFGAATTFTTGAATDPISVATADLNGDGNLDLVTANHNTGNISVLLGNGAGAFAAPVTHATGAPGPENVAIADVDGDGKLDVAVANDSGSASVLLGDGTGGFGTAANFATGAVTSSVALGDFNHDGGLDLAVTNSGLNNISVLLNNGTNMSPAATTVLHFDAPPEIDLNGGGPAGSGFTRTFTENGPAVPIADASVLITDPDNAALASIKIVLTNAKPGDRLFVNGPLPGGIGSSIDTSLAGQITLTLFNPAVLADYQTALTQVQFSNSSDNPDPTVRGITIVGSDGELSGPAALATIQIVPVNDAPVLGGDDLIDLTAGSTVAVTTADLTATDPDNSNTQLVYTVTGTSHGGVRLNGAPATSFTQQDLVNNAVSFQHDGGHEDGSFTISLTDGIAAPQSATVHVTVPPDPFNNVTGHNTFGPTTGDYFVFQDSAGTKTALIEEIQNNTVVASHLLGRIGSDWTVDGADNFDGDGDNDLLWHRDHGGVRELLVVQLDNGTVVRGVGIGNVGTDWNVDATGDFNHDGTADILIGRDTGGVRQLEVLDMKNNAVQSAHVIGTMGQDWQVDGARDFNGDGTADLLLHRDVGGTRFLRVLDMQNGNVSAVHDLGPMGAGWQIDAAGDFNHDGTADILIHQDVGATRQLRILDMRGGVVSAVHDIGAVGTDWFVDGVGDFNNDGTADIALHRDAGGTRTLETLEIHNSVVTAAHALGAIGLDLLVH